MFKLPSRRASDQGGIPTQPRKLKRWLAELPMVNMGDATRQFFNGLQALNRAGLPAEDHLELLELMHPTTDAILGHLGRHFINRTLPLPEKSCRIAELNKAILSELAAGYGRVAQGNAGGKRGSEKLLALALYRAMRYTGEILMHSWRLYEPAPEGAWLELHRLYRTAEEQQVLDKPVLDGSGTRRDSVGEAFKRLCLLALARPLSLRQGETDRVAAYLETFSGSAVIIENPMPDSANGVHVIDLDGDAAPVYRNMADVPEEPRLRILNLNPLVRELREALQGGGSPSTQAMSSDLVHRVLNGWHRTARRRFSRAERDDEINVAIGLASIYATIESDLEKRFAPGHRSYSMNDLQLQAISEDHRRMNGHGASFLAQAATPNDANAWDMVGRGNVITDAYQGHASVGAVTALGLESRDSRGEPWRIVDTSAGGFRLRWRGQHPSRVQVGELVGLREKEGNQYQWRVGVIRWMLNRAARGLEIGVQVLAPKTLLITLEPSRMGRPIGAAEGALLLPAIKTIQQPPTLLAPAGKFRIGDEVIATLAGRAMRIKLASLAEHSSLFVQYRYVTLGHTDVHDTHEDRSTPVPGRDKDRFDDVWTLI